MSGGGGFNENSRASSSGGGLGLYSLKWNSFQSHVTKGLSKLLEENSYTDVTLACEGEFLKAHKLLLSLCSPFFKRLFEVNNSDKSEKNTIVILNNVRFKDLENIIRFIYNGQTNVSQADLHSFLETGELLQIEGLASCSTGHNLQNEGNVVASKVNSPNSSQLPPLPTLQSYPVRSQSSATTSNSTMGVNSLPLDSRLRASLTNTSPTNTQTRVEPGITRPTSQQHLPPPKRPRLMNTNSDLPGPSGSRLQSILTGQSYTSPPLITLRPTQNSVRLPDPIMEKDPLGQDDEVVHIEEAADEIECEPMIKMGAKTESIQVYSIEDDEKDENFSEDGEDEFEDSHQEMTENECSNQDLYLENVELAGRQQGGPSTTLAGPSQVKNDKSGTPSASNERNAGAIKKRGRNPKYKYRACNYCGGLFYRSNLSRHMSQVHAQILLAQGKRLFRCAVCKTLYRSTGHLQAHMQKQHGELRPGIRSNETGQQISTPNRTFSPHFPSPMFEASTALREMALAFSHPVKPYTAATSITENEKSESSEEEADEMVSCEVCNLLFEANQIEDHLYKVHGRGSALCPFCNRYFKNKNSLKVHKSMYHRRPRLSTEGETSNSFSISIPPEDSAQIRQEGTRTNSLLGITFKEIHFTTQTHQQEEEPLSDTVFKTESQ